MAQNIQGHSKVGECVMWKPVGQSPHAAALCPVSQGTDDSSDLPLLQLCGLQHTSLLSWFCLPEHSSPQTSQGSGIFNILESSTQSSLSCLSLHAGTHSPSGLSKTKGEDSPAPWITFAEGLICWCFSLLHKLPLIPRPFLSTVCRVNGVGSCPETHPHPQSLSAQTSASTWPYIPWCSFDHQDVFVFLFALLAPLQWRSAYQSLITTWQSHPRLSWNLLY